jgi:hypothetical protein
MDASTGEKQIATNEIVCLPNIDFTHVRVRVSREYSDLNSERLDELERQYLYFLMRCKAEPAIKHQPDEDVDRYWHAHILYTRQYAEDCQNYFGYFLHHQPNDGSGCRCDDGCAAVSD